MPLPSTPSEKMYRALQHQLDAEYLDARRLYLEEIAERGKNPDALNMLAVVEWHLGNVVRADELITDAVRLAPDVAAIRANENLIHRARALRKFRPAIFDPDSNVLPADPGGRRLIHVCEIAGDLSGGTEHRAIELANRLEQCCRCRPLDAKPQPLVDLHITPPDQDAGRVARPLSAGWDVVRLRLVHSRGCLVQAGVLSTRRRALQRRRPNWDFDAAATGVRVRQAQGRNAFCVRMDEIGNGLARALRAVADRYRFVRAGLPSTCRTRAVRRWKAKPG